MTIAQSVSLKINAMNTIKQLRKYLKITQTELAEKIGVTMHSVQNWENGRAVPSIATYEVIAEIFGANKNWLLTGEGEMISDAQTTNAQCAQTEEYRFFPDVYASAGNGYINTIEEYETVVVDNRIAKLIGLPCAVEIIRVYGDSMEPKYRSGDWIFIDRHVTGFKMEGIYAIMLEGVLMVKYLQKIPGGVRIHSLNGEYKDIDYIFAEQPEDCLSVVGLVKGAITFN